MENRIHKCLYCCDHSINLLKYLLNTIVFIVILGPCSDVWILVQHYRFRSSFTAGIGCSNKHRNDHWWCINARHSQWWARRLQLGEHLLPNTWIGGHIFHLHLAAFAHQITSTQKIHWFSKFNSHHFGSRVSYESVVTVTVANLSTTLRLQKHMAH